MLGLVAQCNARIRSYDPRFCSHPLSILRSVPPSFHCPSPGEKTMRSSFNRKARMTMAVACLAVTAQVAGAQAKGAANFGLGYTDVGVVVGLGGLGGASASFGGRFEHAIKALPD